MYSIIIPIYNAEQYLHKCIDSILIQNNTDFELLLVDDGSIDNSGEICNEYASKDNRIKVFHKPNGGVSSARNLGIEHATGEWITFIDADDYIDENYLPINYNQNNELLIQNWKNYPSGLIEEFYRPNIYKKQVLSVFLEQNLNSFLFRVPWAKFYKKNIIQKNNIRFNEKLFLAEDTIFVINYLQHCKQIEIIATSFYLHLKNTNFFKYPLKTDYSLMYLEIFWNSYRKLPYKSTKLVNTIYHTFWDCTTDKKEKKNYNKWYANPYVIKLLRISHYRKGIRNHIIYYKLCILSLIKRLILKLHPHE